VIRPETAAAVATVYGRNRRICPKFRASVAFEAGLPYVSLAMQATSSPRKTRKSNKQPKFTAQKLIESAQSADQPPKGLTAAIEALWWDVHDDPAKALEVAEPDSGLNAIWVRAYLRRKRGDDSIAAYLYAKAIRPLATGSHVAERDTILKVLLKES
jgi:hypothetical protein